MAHSLERERDQAVATRKAVEAENERLRSELAEAQAQIALLRQAVDAAIATTERGLAEVKP